MKRGHFLLAVVALVSSACGGGGGASSIVPPPATPTDVVVDVATEQLWVAWRPVAGATGYDVLLSPTPGRDAADLAADPEVLTTVVRDGSSCVLDALPPGSTWYVLVDAFGPGGTSPPSDEVAATLPPSAPASVALEAGMERVGISWSEADGATAYDVYLALEADLSSASWATCEGGRVVRDAEAPLEVTGLEGDRACYVVVVARNEGGSSPDSALAAATPLVPPPEPVVDLQAEGAAGEIVLTWSALPGATYVLYLALEPGVSKLNWQDLEGGERHVGVTSPFVLEGLEPGTTVYFVVTLVQGVQESPESVVVSATASARGTFRLGELVGVGAAPADVVVSDLDDDGVLDFVTANRGGGTLSVGQGLGQGQFDVVDEPAVGESPCALDVGDVNGDRVPDLAVLLADEGAILVLAGDGALAFEELARLESDLGGGTLRLVDLDGDDNLDLVATDTAEDLVRVWLGDGDGGFVEADSVETGREPAGITPVDLDQDGILDLVVSNAMDSSVSLLVGDGEGAFDALQPDSTIPLPIATLALDWDGAAGPDLWVVGAASAELRSQGEDGTYAGLAMIDLGVEPSAAAAGDFDGDGALELVFLGRASSTLQVFDRASSGQIVRRQFVEELTCGTGTVAVHDFDGDGILDLLFCAEEADGVRLMLGND